MPLVKTSLLKCGTGILLGKKTRQRAGKKAEAWFEMR